MPLASSHFVPLVISRSTAQRIASVYQKSFLTSEKRFSFVSGSGMPRARQRKVTASERFTGASGEKIGSPSALLPVPLVTPSRTAQSTAAA